MLSSMAPTIVLKNGKVVLTLGSMGGSRIITAIIQIILNIFEHQMTVQEAVDAPRVHHQWLPDVLRCEKFALSKDVEQRLKFLGHTIEALPPYSSEAQAIFIDQINGYYLGAADPRLDGKAIGY
jgi:gamma-glutamyltranspeptidase/glutathione hydrolase